MDKLTPPEVEQFYRIKHSLYLFVNKKLNILKHCHDWQDIGKNKPEEIVKVRDYVFKHLQIIDEFIQQNPFNLSEEDLTIADSWKKAVIADKFILIKHTKNNTLFFGKSKVYGIVGLMDSFNDMFEGYAPIFISFIILPFKAQFNF